MMPKNAPRRPIEGFSMGNLIKDMGMPLYASPWEKEVAERKLVFVIWRLAAKTAFNVASFISRVRPSTNKPGQCGSTLKLHKFLCCAPTMSFPMDVDVNVIKMATYVFFW